MENSFKNIIDQSKSILILLPTKPYFDQVAGGLSIYLSLRETKDVQIYAPAPMTVEFNRLIGVNRIVQELGNKNLVIRFVDYKANDIERVSYDIEDGQFRLSVIPKQSITPPSKDQVDLSYSGVTVDMVILVGGTNESHFPVISSKELGGANLVHIGTRDISLSSHKSYISFSRPASSVSEVVAGLIKEIGISINEDTATNILMGIEDASGNFTNTAVTAETFAVVAELMRAGGRRTSAQPIPQRESFPPGAIPGMQYRMQTPPQTYQPVQRTTQQAGSGQTQVHDQPDEKIVEVEPEAKKENTPSDWLSAPKIYKGDSIS
ncbi:hypothetical protein A2865_01930 [Candidatus Woesebacteria bacterium RIFCSPHIGHO2_01_FULL_39_17]|uniref:Uncharacterized protein n=2 Tax=Candidatus Woeseibacteriota TaxID=1752722 RepID=A0A0G0NDD5_9BACT|nr:MAG: hypothetical protein US72_C0001G0011 [Microgenomates group bacterium GW2011_GWC1_38_12]KKR14139.1 MAG: hypothetical protein UT40_C0005G0068 [Candidatus Woesebacteria bacterium GW2011_GWA1_39_21b]OGM22782.1 MAG: hypothetical protein A2865_01930 [Candidatus Woesebacteria bacterium RIFCSPHIGHO2_01_FULL_39_17]OGM61713.1 MAG: hypothetical protein A3A52_04120 [Candidatus Woesebacteria bacterium RIFCSPLOWO2_01_FULL_39_14]